MLPQKSSNENSALRHPTKSPKVNRSREYRPWRERISAVSAMGAVGSLAGYNPRKQREISAARTSGERVVSGGWRSKGNWGRTVSARREAGGWMRMKKSYVEGVAAHNGPEFMRRRSRGRRRSVDRGNGGLGIEPRNVECPGRRRCREKRKATRRAPSWRGARRPRAVRDPMHAGTPSTRKPGGPWIAWRGCAKPQRQGYGRNPLMHGPGKSDPPIVPGKRPNKPGRPGAEAVEGRGGAKGTAGRQSTGRTQSRETVSQALACVREAAKRNRNERFSAPTTLVVIPEECQSIPITGYRTHYRAATALRSRCRAYWVKG